MSEEIKVLKKRLRRLEKEMSARTLLACAIGFAGRQDHLVPPAIEKLAKVFSATPKQVERAKELWEEILRSRPKPRSK